MAYLRLRLANLSVVLARAAQALAPGGRILVVGHDVINIAHGVGGPQDPAILYTHRRSLPTYRGLTVRRADRVRRPVATDQGVLDAIDTLVSAVRD